MADLLVISRVRHALQHRAKLGAVAQVMGIRIVALAGNVCSGVLTAAFLGPGGRGRLAAMIVAPTVLASVCTLGLHASLIYNLRSDPEHGSCYFGSSLILTFLTGLVAGALGCLLMPVWLSRYDGETVMLARLLLVTVPIGVATPLLMGVLEANNRFAAASKTLYLQSLGALALLLILTRFGRLTPFSAAVAYLAPWFCSFFYLLARARRVLSPRLTIADPYPRRLLRYGLRFYGVDILGTLSIYLDQLVLVFLLQPAAVGAYAVALSLSRVLSVAQGAVSTVLFPSIAAREPASVVEMVARAARVTIVVNGAAAAAIGIAGPSLLLLLYGPRFTPSIAPFLVLVAEAVVSSAARTLAQAFSGTGRPSAVTIVEVAGVATSLTTMLVLVPPYGIVGAAFATLVGGFARLGCVLASFRRVLGLELPSLVISRADVAWVSGR